MNNRARHCEACIMIKNGVKSRLPLEHTCGRETGAIPEGINPEQELKWDYKSRDWEKENSRIVCVACLNESRTHQIPGNWEHTCNKSETNGK